MLMNIHNEVRNHLIGFLKKVLDQSYTRSEWENFSCSMYQNDVLEDIRVEVSSMIAKNLEPNSFKMKAMTAETRDSIQAIINELDADCVWIATKRSGNECLGRFACVESSSAA